MASHLRSHHWHSFIVVGGEHTWAQQQLVFYFWLEFVKQVSLFDKMYNNGENQLTVPIYLPVLERPERRTGQKCNFWKGWTSSDKCEYSKNTILSPMNSKELFLKNNGRRIKIKISLVSFKHSILFYGLMK